MRKLLLLLFSTWALPCSLSAQAGDGAAAQYQNQAVSHLLGNEYAAALEKLEIAAALYRRAADWKQYFSCFNQMTSIHLETGQYDRAKRTTKKALWESIEKLGRDNPEAARAGHKLGEVYSVENRHEDALEAHRLAIMIRRKLHGGQHPDVADSYDWLGRAYAAGGNHERAEAYFRQSLDLRKKLLGAEAAEVADSYFLLGELAASRQQPEQALADHRQALAIRERKLNPLDPALAQSYIELGHLYAARGERGEAARNYRQAVSIGERGGLLKREVLRVPLSYLAAAHLRDGDMTAAQAAARQLLALPKEQKTAPRSPSIYDDYQLGAAFYCQGALEEAVDFFEGALSSKREMPLAACYYQLIDALRHKGEPARAVTRAQDYRARVSEPLAAADACLQLGYSLLRNGEPQAALDCLEQCLLPASAPLAWKQESWLAQAEAYWQLRDFQRAVQAARQAASLGAASPHVAFARLQAYGIQAMACRALARQDRNALANLEAALEAVGAADELLKTLLRQPLFVWQLDWMQQHQEQLYEIGIQACFDFYQQRRHQTYIDQAFYFAERSKQIGLALPLLQAGPIAFSQVPSQLLDTERSLQQEAWRLSCSWRIAALAGESAERLEKAQESNLGLYAANLQAIEQQAPKYFDLKYGYNTAELSRLQPYLKSQAAAVYAFFAGKQQYYVFFADGQSLSFFRYPLEQKMLADLERFGKLSSKGASASPQQFAALAASLYRRLPPAELESGIEQLCILPHGPFELFPFEALVADAPEMAAFPTMPYLGRQYRLAYNYQAAALLKSAYGATITPRWRFHAIIPYYGSQSKGASVAYARSSSTTASKPYASLPHFAHLSERWAEGTGGQLWSGEQADECRFRNISQADILLIGGQTVLAEAALESYIAASAPSDSSCRHHVGIEAIYGLEQLAELGILPSILTLEGARRSSLMHLAQALQYSGCQSLILHRWPNPGPPSEELVQLFLENYQSRTAIPAALLLARQGYLQQQEEAPDFAHPHYWAGYMHFGGLQPVAPPSRGYPFWIIAGIAALMLVGWSVRRR